MFKTDIYISVLTRTPTKYFTANQNKEKSGEIKLNKIISVNSLLRRPIVVIGPPRKTHWAVSANTLSSQAPKRWPYSECVPVNSGNYGPTSGVRRRGQRPPAHLPLPQPSHPEGKVWLVTE